MTDPEKKGEGEPKINLPDDVTKVLEDIKAKLNNSPVEREETPPGPSAPSYAERRAILQKTLGYTDDQMAAHEQMIVQNQAPVVENLGWIRLEKKTDIDSFRKEIESELSIYPAEKRTPDVMEKIYFMVKGKRADSKPAAAAGTSLDGRVVDARVTRGPGYSGSEPGISRGDEGGGGPSEEEDQLNDQEKFVASKLGVNEKDYALSRKAGKNIRELKVPDQRPVTSLADIELRRLTKSR